MSGIGRGDPPGSDARERKGSWDSIRACHGDEEVAAGGGLWARGKERRAPALRQGQWRRSGRVGGQRKQEVAREAAQSGRRRCTGEHGSRAGKQAGGGRIWTDLQFQKFQGPNCKPAITFNLGLK